MKKFAGLLMATAMICGLTIPALAADPGGNWAQGTQVTYDSSQVDADNDGNPDNVESYTVTVPAFLAPGGEGTVSVSGTWASNRQVSISADESVTLTNSITGADEKVLDVTFAGITKAGSNTAAVSAEEAVFVADIENALFGTWSGTFNYTVAMSDVASAE